MAKRPILVPAALLTAALAGLVTVVHGSPWHTVIVGPLTVAAVSAVAALLLPLERWYHHHFGRPWPLARNSYENNSVVLSIQHLARIEQHVECTVVLPNRKSVRRSAQLTIGQDKIVLRFPNDFQEYLQDPQYSQGSLLKGRHRVVWTPYRRRQGSDEYLEAIASARFRISKRQSSKPGN